MTLDLQTFRSSLMFPVALALLGASSPVQAAGTAVEVVGLAFDSGKERVLVRGEMSHAPARMVRGDGDPWIVDACGTLHSARTDVRALEPALAVQGLDALASPHRTGQLGLYGDALYRHDFSERSRMPEYGEPVAGWPADLEVAVIVATTDLETRFPFRSDLLVIDEDGTLSSVALLDSGAELQPIGAKGAYAGATHARLVTRRPESGLSIATLLHVDEDGRIFQSELFRDDRRERRGGTPNIAIDLASVRPERIGDFELDDPRQIVVRDPATATHLQVVDGEGRVEEIEIATGARTQLGRFAELAAPDAFEILNPRQGQHRDPVTGETFDALFVRAGGDDFASCPDKKALAAAAAKAEREAAESAANAQERAIAAYDAIKEVHGEHHASARSFVSEWRSRIDGVKRMQPQDVYAQRDEILAGLERFEAERLAPIREAVEAFQAAFPEQQAFRDALRGSDYRVNRELRDLEDIVEEASDLRPGFAQMVLAYADPVASVAEAQDRLKPEKRVAGFDAAIVATRAALAFEPGNEKVAERVAEYEAKKEAAQREFTDMIADTPWPTHQYWNGTPEEADALAAEALAYVNARHGGVYFDAVICSGWIDSERNYKNEIMSYHYVACLMKPHPENPELAIVSEATLITEGPVKAAPYDRVLVHDESYVLLSKAPADVDVAEIAGAGGGTGLLAWLGRVVLAGVLLGGGLLFAGPMLAERVPAAAAAVSRARSVATPIGLAALAIGGFGLLLSLVTLSPLAHLLPLCAATGMGLLVYREWQGRPQLDEEASDPRSQALAWLGRAADATAPLAGSKPVVGPVCLGLAAVHLVLGSVALL